MWCLVYQISINNQAIDPGDTMKGNRHVEQRGNHRRIGGKSTRCTETGGKLYPGADRRGRPLGGLAGLQGRQHRRLREDCRGRDRQGCLRGQNHQTQGQGLRGVPGHQACQDRRCDRTGRSPGAHEIRQAGGRHRGPHAGDKPHGDAGQQRDGNPEGPQRRHLRPPPGGQALLPRGLRIHAGGAAQGRRPA